MLIGKANIGFCPALVNDSYGNVEISASKGSPNHRDKLSYLYTSMALLSFANTNFVLIAAFRLKRPNAIYLR